MINFNAIWKDKVKSMIEAVSRFTYILTEATWVYYSEIKAEPRLSLSISSWMLKSPTVITLSVLRLKMATKKKPNLKIHIQIRDMDKEGSKIHEKLVVLFSIFLEKY